MRSFFGAFAGALLISCSGSLELSTDAEIPRLDGGSDPGSDTRDPIVDLGDVGLNRDTSADGGTLHCSSTEHVENGICVPNTLQCGTEMREETGVC